MLYSQFGQCYIVQLANNYVDCPETAAVCRAVTELQTPQMHSVGELDTSQGEVNCCVRNQGACIRILAAEGE
jgi:hypothetical protein